MATLTPTGISYALKTIYIPEKIEKHFYQNSPLIGMMKKEKDFTGNNFSYPLLYSPGGGTSYSFQDAQNYTDYGKGKSVTLSRTHGYITRKVTNETILATANDPGSFLRAREDEIDNCFYNLGRSVANMAYRNGSGAKAQVGATITATTFNLATTKDVRFFEVGDNLVFAADESSALRSSSPAEVTKVDRSTGTITITGVDLTAIGVTASTDYAFPKGTYAAASDRNALLGLDFWVPSTAPSTTETAINCDRSADPSRMAGIRVTASSGSTVQKAILDGAFAAYDEGGMPDKCFIHTTQFKNLIEEVQTKAVYVKTMASSKAEVYFEGVKILGGPAGPIEVYPDADCQTDVAWILTMDSWRFKTLGEAPRFLSNTETGAKWEPVYNDDALELRMGWFGNIYCKNPGQNCRVALS